MKKALVLTLALLLVAAFGIFAAAQEEATDVRGDIVGGGVLWPLNKTKDADVNPGEILGPSELQLKLKLRINGTDVIPDTTVKVVPEPTGLVDPAYDTFGPTEIGVTGHVFVPFVKVDGHLLAFATGDPNLLSGEESESEYYYLHYLTNRPWRDYIDNVYFGAEIGWSYLTMDALYSRNYGYMGASIWPEKRCHDWWIGAGLGSAAGEFDVDADRLTVAAKLRVVGNVKEIAGIFTPNPPDWGKYIEVFVEGGIGFDYVWGSWDRSAIIACTKSPGYPVVVMDAGGHGSFDGVALTSFAGAGIGVEYPFKNGMRAYGKFVYRHQWRNPVDVVSGVNVNGYKETDYLGGEVGLYFSVPEPKVFTEIKEVPIYPAAPEME